MAVGTHLWLVWLDICIAQTFDAEAARGKRLAERAIGGEYLAQHFLEFRASLVAVSAAAHAIDGFYGSAKDQIRIPAELASSWQARPPKRRSQILETLKIGFDVGRHAEVWAEDFTWLWNLRDPAVHHKTKVHEPIPDPVDGRLNVSEEIASYTADAARRSLDVAVDVIRECINNPRHDQPEAESWAAEALPALELVDPNTGKADTAIRPSAN